MVLSGKPMMTVGIGIIFVAFLGLVLTVGFHVYKKRRTGKSDEKGNVVVRKPAYVLDSFPM